MDKIEKILYLDCCSGISGDMTVGALLDLGASRQALEQALKSLGVDGYHLHFGRKKKCGIDAYDFDVHLEEEGDVQNFSHDYHHHGQDISHDSLGLHSHSGTDSHEHHLHSGVGSHEHHSHSGVDSHEHHSHSGVDSHEHHTHSGMDSHECHYTHSEGDSHEHHPHSEADSHTHHHFHSETYSHEHSHPHIGHHAHIHRNIHDIYAIIDCLEAGEVVKKFARRVFGIVAEAESVAHGIPVEEVHFHEVGAIDSIVDIISVAVCLDNLGIDRVIVSPLAEGTGYVKCQHGVMPVPVPATANIAAAYGLELKRTANEGEMVTPTGAAIAAALSTGEPLPANYKIEKIGIGAGNKDFPHANILRAMIIKPVEHRLSPIEHQSASVEHRPAAVEYQTVPVEKHEPTPSGLWILETNLDDCTGEALGFTMDALLHSGVNDVWYTPIYMKKNRPAYLLSVLCSYDRMEEAQDIILAQTTTIGIRRYPVERTVMDRKLESLDTPYGKALVKTCNHKGKTYYYPEYESIRAICTRHGLDFGTVYHMVMEAAIRQER